MRGFRTITQTFDEVTRIERVTVLCSGCRKPRIRTVKVTHTVNPFNRNKLGHVRSPQEVLERVRAELADRVAKVKCTPLICRTCEASHAAGIRPSASGEVG